MLCLRECMSVFVNATDSKRQNKEALAACSSFEQIRDELLTLTDPDMLNQAEYMRIHAQLQAFTAKKIPVKK